MPPKPTRTPERLELPGGYYIQMHGAPDGMNLYDRNGLLVFYRLSFGEDKVKAFAAAMNGAAELTASKVNELASRRGKSILPQVAAALQSPAGEWRDTQQAVDDALDAFIADLDRECGFTAYAPTVRAVQAAKKLARALPPAPTGEVK